MMQWVVCACLIVRGTDFGSWIRVFVCLWDRAFELGLAFFGTSFLGFVVKGMWKDLVDCRELCLNSCLHGCEIGSVSWVLLSGVLLKDSSWFLESKVCGRTLFGTEFLSWV